MTPQSRSKKKKPSSRQDWPQIWSATPTPFTDRGKIDKPSVRRMVEHHVNLGVNGLFVCGTCGEGPWMNDRQRTDMIRATVDSARGRLLVAAQVTDNSPARITSNAELARSAGADIAVIAPPYFMVNAKPSNIEALYTQAIERCPLPVGIYDRGIHSPLNLPRNSMKRVYSHEKVKIVKDSSVDPSRMTATLAAGQRRPDLMILTGDEFGCVDYLQNGYHGALLGGGIFNAHYVRLMASEITAGHPKRAADIQKHMNEVMWKVYGGKRITCWLAGLKYLLVLMGIFRNTHNLTSYRLTKTCAANIEKLLDREYGMIMPYKRDRKMRHTGVRKSETK